MANPDRGAKFWLQVVTELQNRGVQGIFIVCVDRLKDFPDAVGVGLLENRGLVDFHAEVTH